MEIYWQSFSEFLAMGGKGFFVWASVFIVFGALKLEVLTIMLNHQKTINTLKNSKG